MEKKRFRWTTYVVFALLMLLVVSFVLVGPDFTKMDYGNNYSRKNRFDYLPAQNFAVFSPTQP